MTSFLGTTVIPKLSAAPGSPVSGQIYYDTTVNKAFYYNGTTWIDMTGTPSFLGATKWGND